MRIKIKRRTYKIIVFLLIVLIETATILGSWYFISIGWSSRYDKENFNCVDMSYICADVFKKMGLPVKIVYGTNKINYTLPGHCWLLLFDWIEFESTTLKPNFFHEISDKYNINLELEDW